MNIRHVRLINGDELITEYVTTTGTKNDKLVVLRNPLVVDRSEDGNVVLITYNPYSAKPEVEFQSSHVLNITDVHPEIERYYNNSLIANRKYMDGNIIERIRLTNDSIESQMKNKTFFVESDLEDSFLLSLDTPTGSIN